MRWEAWVELRTVRRMTPDAPTLFAGLRLADSESELRVEGLWNCRALATEGGEPLNFSLKLSQQGNVVRVGNPGEAIVGLGAFDGKQLTLNLTNEQKTFTLHAQATGRTLNGEWQENGTSTKGTWSATLPDSTPPERRSPALVVLREFRKSDQSGYDYSIDADPPPRCLPNGRPICRVWKVPGAVLTLDWQAKPATGM